MLGDKNWDEREGDSYRALLRSHSDLVMIPTCYLFLLATFSYLLPFPTCYLFLLATFSYILLILTFIPDNKKPTSALY